MLSKMHLSRKTCKRIVAVSAAVSICTTTLVNLDVGTHPSFRAKGASSDTSNPLILGLERSLAYKGEREYTMTLDASAYLAKKQMPKSAYVSDDGFYTAPFEGDYLIQLWGGAGGAGSNKVLYIPVLFFDDIVKVYPGGAGGAGGYVSGIVHLKAGQTLVYNIGTKGQPTQSEEEGGGINGDGGNHGDIGSQTVGGGGGYSAVYLYDVGEFDGETIRPSEADRMSKYIMIAGGGGGGGAGDIGAEKPSDGGAAGYMTDRGSGEGNTASPSGTLSSADAPVAGTYFAGSDGKSSGDSTKYVGKGGSFEPGAYVKDGHTVLGVDTGLIGSSTPANDWFRTVYPKAIGGAGGAGNLRGGAGGAGYCGGSGGIMEGLLDADDVGGGGGGSSFIATDIVKQESDSLAEGDYLKSNPSQDGGCCYIKFLERPDTYDPYDDVTINIPTSQYFDVTDITVENAVYDENRAGGDENIVWELNGARTNTDTFPISEGPITLSHINIRPDKDGVEMNKAKITVTLKAKDDFAGGNYVPLLSGTIQLTYEGVNEDKVPAYSSQENLDYVNVPLSYELETKSIWIDQSASAVPAENLYTQKYGETLDPVNEAFIVSRSACGVYAPGSTTAGDSFLPTETTDYTVKFTVKPNTKYAEIGPRQKEITVAGTATINVSEGFTTDKDHSGGDGSASDPGDPNVLIETIRKLEYTADGKYETTIALHAETVEIPCAVDDDWLNTTYQIASTALTPNTDGTIVIPADGWYLLQAWGATGGKGQGAIRNKTSIVGDLWGLLGTDAQAGGGGGTGGYISGYVYLSKDSVLMPTTPTQPKTYETGDNSIDYAVFGDYRCNVPTDNINTAGTALDSDTGLAIGQGGVGAEPTTISLNGDVLLVAGGGGGGGGAALSTDKTLGGSFGKIDRPGGAASTSTNAESDSYSLEACSGTSGNTAAYVIERKGYITWPTIYGGYYGVSSLTAATGGTAGANYHDDSVKGNLESDEKYGQGRNADVVNIAPNTTTNPNGVNGAVLVTPISRTENHQIDYPNLSEEEAYVANLLTSISLQATLGDYFTLSGNSDNFTVSGKTLTSKAITADDITVTLDDTKMPYTYKAALKNDLLFTIDATPLEGFLGGNGVPIFASSGDSELVNAIYHNGETDRTIRMSHSDAVRYANVEIPEPTFSAKDVTKNYGDAFEFYGEMVQDGGFALPTDTNSLLDDFVTFEKTTDPETIQTIADKTQNYNITYTLAPSDNSKNSKVIPVVSALTYQQNATLFVDCSVTNTLSHLTSNGETTVPYGEEYSCVLTPETGYLLPNSITVTLNGTELSAANGDYSYFRSSGEVVIPADKVTGDLEIIADAKIQTYDLIFQWSADKDNTTQSKQTFSYPAGTVFDDTAEWKTFADGIFAEMENKFPGYAFAWDYQQDPVQDETTGEWSVPELTEMPARNHYVFGSFSQIPRALRIEYELPSGATATAPEPYMEYCYDGDTINIPSPAVDGYIPYEVYDAVAENTYSDTPNGDDPYNVYSEINGNDVVKKVVYKALEHEICIRYIMEDGSQAFDMVNATASDLTGTQTFTSPELTGYTPDVASFEVAPTDALYAVVTYHPNEITVSFDANGGSEVEDRTAYYGMEYGVDTHDENYKYTHSALPIPVRTGYTFDGWFTDVDDSDTQVTENTICDATSAVSLIAKWTPNIVKLTVNYQKDSEDEPFFTETIEYMPEVTGDDRMYTIRENDDDQFADMDLSHYNRVDSTTEKIVVGLVNKTVYVLYKGEDCTLKVNYVIVGSSDVKKTVTLGTTYEYGKEYSEEVAFPEDISGVTEESHMLSPSTVSGVMKDVDSNNIKTVTVSLIPTGTTISVTVSWDSLTFTAADLTWDPETHTYLGDAKDLEGNGERNITVTNDSDVPITAEFSYENSAYFEDLDCTFKKNDTPTESIVVGTTASDAVSVNLSGTYPGQEIGTYRAGTCKVKITAGSNN